MLGIMLSLSVLVLNQQRIVGNVTKSNQSYITAEAGLEDILLRIKNGMEWTASYSLPIGTSSADIVVSDVVDDTRTITSTGDSLDRIRKISVVHKISNQDVTFFYGIQVGDLGLVMNGNAEVHGNVFSNGPITGAANTKIYGDAIAAGPNGLIDQMKIKNDEGGGSAWAVTLKRCNIDQDAHYTNISGCSVDGTSFSPEPWVEPEPLPITQEDIDDWKEQALVGGTMNGYSLGGNDTATIGPKKIIGDMTLDSNVVVTINGTLWVTGDVNLNSNAILQLDPGYGEDSGVIIVDGNIFIDSNITFCGSEGYKQIGECNPSAGSYLMLLSDYSSSDPLDPAIDSTSNTKTAILYAANGFIKLSAGSKLKEATGYGMVMDSNANVTYETGLANVRFTGGPGVGLNIKSWKETE